ncbi:MAG TPA: hypothetical protein VJC07_00270 [Candidatus Nanoarchaeia archaeon]|nr:hypothetical protein [Candidatus Nanoarchaeia archaeon]
MRRKCISCNELILKSAKTNPYLCRICEYELQEMGSEIPAYFLEN